MRREQNDAQEAWAERSKERQKWQAELQTQERLLKLQKLNERGVPLANFPCEIVSLNTLEADQVQETVDLQPAADKQVTRLLYTNRSFWLFISVCGVSLC